MISTITMCGMRSRPTGTKAHESGARPVANRSSHLPQQDRPPYAQSWTAKKRAGQGGSFYHMAFITPPEGALIAVIADEDTITGFLLSGMGNIDLRKKSNFLVVDSKTSPRTVEAAFKEFTSRDDIAIVLISQNVAGQIRSAIEQHTKAVPSVLEIPSKDAPYDPNQDSLLLRVKHIMGLSA